MSETDPRRRAVKAKAELAETDTAFSAMRSAALERIVGSKAGEQALREHLYRTVQVIDTVRKHLTEMVQNGDFEAVMEEITKQSA